MDKRRFWQRMTIWFSFSVITILLLAACTGGQAEPAVSSGETEADAATQAKETAVPDPTDTPEETTAEATTSSTTTSDETELSESPPLNIDESLVETGDNRPDNLTRLTASWDTNWSRHTIDYNELLSGGPPRDGIPPIDNPKFVTPEEAEEWLAGNEPVIALEINGDARAYPLQILTWHEITNDEVGGIPVTVTFCPLCNSAIAFDRRLGDRVLDFGTSGLLRHSDLVMWDRQTESLWQQFTGRGIVGDLAGAQLRFIPSAIVSFDDFRSANPDGKILSRETGIVPVRPYGENPYVGYDRIDQNPFLFRGETDDRLPAMARVVTVSPDNADIAYPLEILSEKGVIHDTVNGRELVVFHKSGTSTALGASNIASGRDVGATGVFDPNVDGQKLTFRKDGDQIIDEQTESTWNILGEATDGPLAGKKLEPIVHADHFWFSWAAFKPDTIIYSDN